MTDPHGRRSTRAESCTTHHRAFDCREAVHREVAEALDRLCHWWSDEAIHSRAEDWARARESVEEYRRMYG